MQRLDESADQWTRFFAAKSLMTDLTTELLLYVQHPQLIHLYIPPQAICQLYELVDHSTQQKSLENRWQRLLEEGKVVEPEEARNCKFALVSET